MDGDCPNSLLDELTRLEALRDARKAASATRDRAFDRFVIRVDCELLAESRSRLDRTAIEIKTRDVARGGIGFVCQQPLEVGSSWLACFKQHGFVVAQQSLAIRHCREVSPGVYLIGAQFVANPGLLAILGVDPAAIDDGDTNSIAGSIGEQSFLAPSDVA